MTGSLTIHALMVLALGQAPAPSGWTETSTQAAELLLAEKGTEAIALLERAVEQAPAFDEARYQLAGAHEYQALRLSLQDPPRPQERRRHMEQAAAHYRQVASRPSDYQPLAVANLMMLYDEGGFDQPREVVAFARQYAALTPQSAVGHVTLARTLRALGDHAAATQAFVAACSSVGRDDERVLAVAIAEDLTRGVEYEPSQLQALVAYAEPALDRALVDDPEDRVPAMAKATVLLIRAQRLETDPARRKALEREADRLAFRRRSEADGPAEDRPAADARVLAFVDAPPEGFEAARTEALAVMQRQEYAQAVKVYDAFIASHPTFPDAHYERVGALLSGGRRDAVPAALSAARAALPDDAATRRRMGSALLDVSRRPALAAADARALLAEADALLDEALRLGAGPDEFAALETRRLVLTEQARHETDATAVARLTSDAVRLAARSESLVGSAPGVPAGLAVVEAEAAVLEARRQYAEAAALYGTFLAAHPGFARGHVARVRLLTAADRADLLDQSLQAARAAASAKPESKQMLGTAYWEIAYRTPGLAPVYSRALLEEAVAVFDEVLALEPNRVETLVYKSLVLRQQAGLETDSARAASLTAEADRLRDQATALRDRQP